ncbi:MULTISPECIES: AfsR/SARP family transcriptional regulator [unclassified Crossiella]|uniref:AfsR/SARP family transcriptional regulator n=1 Tax=unclassified Crossiella TaxID=2620835 RepID=UPI0020004516|nr:MULTISPECIES: AfsR/SARP family transcriptional regulator [unclassified Crossiella]MCK2242104.1 AfsR/SARP family transcriptional regulator [Crossiella sp. S99.2]MCK2256007.1 AfsR/SARP family transcriptional regulator [Crossiella sp. S99.1]
MRSTTPHAGPGGELTYPISFGILGSTVIRGHDGVDRQLPVKTSQVLALLLTSLGNVLPSVRIIRSLWGDTPPNSARSMIRDHVKKIRQTIEESEELTLVATHGGYRLNVNDSFVDARVFESLAGQAREGVRSGDFIMAEERLLKALALWRDVEALTDVRNIIELEGEAVRLEEWRLQCQQDLIRCQLVTGRPEQAIPNLRMLTVQYPIRERFWVLLMLAQSALGRGPEASATYRQAQRVCVEENGMPPSAELNLVHEGILRGEPVEHMIQVVCFAPPVR